MFFLRGKFSLPSLYEIPVVFGLCFLRSHNLRLGQNKKKFLSIYKMLLVMKVLMMGENIAKANDKIAHNLGNNPHFVFCMRMRWKKIDVR